MIYEDLYEALKSLNIEPPYGFRVRAYINGKNHPRAAIDITDGPIQKLEEVADLIEKAIPPYSVCIVKDKRIYLDLAKFSNYYIIYQIRCKP